MYASLEFNLLVYLNKPKLIIPIPDQFIHSGEYFNLKVGANMYLSDIFLTYDS
jgi:hypothetical protein